ncbi:hypothetical protein HPB50_017505 [Hyalomma asiaticum]|uniref:Uncharacterized protein n=1 Tax=Hyalomma asiaticum TaxID=266040 RepID=A0ACB7TI07_HYAAI|nr:hypothetical protein HPB50_017505 [Hyalomma asiaticum]
MGRPPAGIFEGTITDFGSFDQCLEVRAQDSWGDESFRGQYCSLFLKPNIDTSRPISFLRNSRRVRNTILYVFAPPPVVTVVASIPHSSLERRT